MLCKLYLKKLLKINWKTKGRQDDQLRGYYTIQTLALKSSSSAVGTDNRIRKKKKKNSVKMLWKVNETRNSDV